jgi:hypothetical protein
MSTHSRCARPVPFTGPFGRISCRGRRDHHPRVWPVVHRADPQIHPLAEKLGRIVTVADYCDRTPLTRLT